MRIAFLVAAGTLVQYAPAQVIPANDLFAKAIQLTGTNAISSSNNTKATKEPGEPDHAQNPGGKSVWWQWQAPSSGYVKISTSGSVDGSIGGALDTVLGVYTGNSVWDLTEVASNDDGPIDMTSEVSFRVNAGVIYRIAVDGYSFSTADPAVSGLIRLSLSFSQNLPLAPAWGPLPCTDGSTLYSTNFAGKVVVLNFWATWCGPCVAEIPDLINLYNAYASDGLVVIGISVDTSTDGVNPPFDLVGSFAAGHGMPYPIAMSRPRAYAVETAYGGVPYIPDTFIIDRQNHIAQTFVGSQSYSTFEEAVVPLLYQNLQLNITVADGTAHIWWPITQLPITVQKKTNLPTALWTDLATAPQSDGVNQYVDVPVGAGYQFFRLHGH